MKTIRIRSIAVLFMLTSLSGCFGYPNSYGHYPTMGNQYGYRYPGQVPYGNSYGYGNYGNRQPSNYGYGNNQGYQPNRDQDDYRGRGDDRGDRGYGQYRRHHDDD